ncbi:MAG TPA: ATP-binding domain-containing protein, partial [Allocoleopsis sp.]
IDKNRKLFANEEEDKSIENASDPLDILDTMVGSIGDDDDEATNDSSHTITVEFVDSGASKPLKSAGEINGMLFSYVLTVHKSQGSEWKRVFIFLHYSHNTMLSRELLYTAVTRARHELFVICEPDRKEIYNSITRAAKSPEIPGTTIAEKAAFFSAKKKSMQKLGDRKQA